jgi:hypothetical protein
VKLTKQQLRKLIIESIKLGSKSGQGYEDNQTKMVRRYLIQLGIGESFFDMNEEQVDSLAADLRLMSPSVKKLRDLHDLSVPTDIWQRNKNLGQTPDGSNLKRIGQMMANRPDDDEESAFLQQSDEQRRDDDAMTGSPWYYEGDDDEA